MKQVLQDLNSGHPNVILAGRRINDSMGAIIGRRLVRFLSEGLRPLRQAKVGILGVTFKENVSDIRNSRAPDILRELENFGVSALIHDPLANAGDVKREYGLSLSSLDALQDCDALILAVPHAIYLEQRSGLLALLGEGGTFMDVKSVINPATVPKTIRYWSL